MHIEASLREVHAHDEVNVDFVCLSCMYIQFRMYSYSNSTTMHAQNLYAKQVSLISHL